ncbi:hypothetical protein MHW47_09410 [Streptomyces sp. OfavH-34-F]|uniref:hypothetical protein n=1 Tax=Streptomyces sp. OfavH-34-F TaxID=2917760 RepID=UPI001EF296E4|nr:hypothetical protein [Streptomyces sp. OfavH-34-F]MCG7524653.1 hypothetical protein [Streptomyces sp. OfavH-34-F]
MPARTQHPRPTHPASSGADVRLPWWAVALPALAFAALLLLIAGPGQAQAATGESATGQLLRHLLALLTR